MPYAYGTLYMQSNIPGGDIGLGGGKKIIDPKKIAARGGLGCAVRRRSFVHGRFMRAIKSLPFNAR